MGHRAIVLHRKGERKETEGRVVRAMGRVWQHKMRWGGIPKEVRCCEAWKDPGT